MSLDDQMAGLLLMIPTSKSEPSSSTESSPSPNPLLDLDTPQQTQSEMDTSSASTHTTVSASSESSPTSASALPSLNVNVKFAPLPEIAPRKRRSTTPLGMAARGQLMRRRRGLYTEQQQLLQQEERERVAALDAQRTPEELEQHRLMQEAVAAQFAVYQALAAAQAAREEEAELELMESELEAGGGGDRRGGSRRRRRRAGGGRSAGVSDDAGDDLEDPFLALGKTLKGASKSFWRKVSHKHGHSPEELEPKGKEVTRRKSDVGLRSRPSEMASGSSSQPLPPPVPPLPALPLRPILATIRSHSNIAAAAANDNTPEEPKEKEEVSGLWEEEIGASFPLNVSQTETIIEGRAVRGSPTRTDTPPPVIPSTPISVVVVKSPILNTSPLRKGQLLKP
jgi:hypothetical protein